MVHASHADVQINERSLVVQAQRWAHVHAEAQARHSRVTGVVDDPEHDMTWTG